MASDNGSGWGKKIVAIVTVVSGLVAIVIFMTGKENIPQLLGTRSSDQGVTVVVAPQQAGQGVKTTAEPIVPPTAMPTTPPIPTRRPTETPVPPPTPIPDTQPGTVLEVGESWYQTGIELALKEAYIDHIPTGPGCWSCGYPAPYLTFYLTNHRTQQMSIRYNLGDVVSAVDNRGRRLTVSVTHLAYVGNYSDFETKTVVLNSEQRVHLQSWGDYGPPSVIILVDTTDTSVTEVIVSVSIAGISNARWRIPIIH